MTRRCSAQWCMNSANEKQLFRFPKDKERSLIWVRFCQRKDMSYVNDSQKEFNGWRLCEDHFSEHDITSRGYIKLIKKDALPLLHPNLTPTVVKNEPLIVNESIINSVNSEIIQGVKREEQLTNKSCISFCNPVLESLTAKSKEYICKSLGKDYFSEIEKCSRSCLESFPKEISTFHSYSEESSVKSSLPNISNKCNSDCISNCCTSLELSTDFREKEKFTEKSYPSPDSPNIFQVKTVTKTYSGKRNAEIAGISAETLSNVGNLHKKLKTYKKLVTNLHQKIYLLENELVKSKKRNNLKLR